ncbi:MAG: hypothetical protein ACPGXY_06895 [Alphaproteobacteria bacterium]
MKNKTQETIKVSPYSAIGARLFKGLKGPMHEKRHRIEDLGDGDSIVHFAGAINGKYEIKPGHSVLFLFRGIQRFRLALSATNFYAGVVGQDQGMEPLELLGVGDHYDKLGDIFGGIQENLAEYGDDIAGLGTPEAQIAGIATKGFGFVLKSAFDIWTNMLIGHSAITVVDANKFMDPPAGKIRLIGLTPNIKDEKNDGEANYKMMSRSSVQDVRNEGLSELEKIKIKKKQDLVRLKDEKADLKDDKKAAMKEADSRAEKKEIRQGFREDKKELRQEKRQVKKDARAAKKAARKEKKGK